MLGSNTFTINAQLISIDLHFSGFSSGEVQFDSLRFNGEELYNPGVPTTIQASGLFEPRSEHGHTESGLLQPEKLLGDGSSSNEWIDDTSTNYAIEFIEDQASLGIHLCFFVDLSPPSRNSKSNQ